MNKLRERWGLTSNRQIWLVLLVFCLTGTTVMLLKKGLFKWSGIDQTEYKTTVSILYYIFILPVYQGLLLAYGYLFGLHTFFWEKEKRFYARIKGFFVKNKEENKI
jgi:hypothetical protein